MYKSTAERLKLIQQLEEEDKNAIFRIIDGMLTKSKFKDFFQKTLLRFNQKNTRFECFFGYLCAVGGRDPDGAGTSYINVFNP